MPPQLSAQPLVEPNILVDSFVGDAQFPAGLEDAADLLWTPFLAQTVPDPLEILLGKVRVSSRQGAPGTRAPLGLTGAVGAVGDVTAIALELAVNGAPVPSEKFCDFGDAKPLQTELSQAYPVLQGELLVSSHRCSLFGRKEKRLFWQLALLNSESVALSI